MLIYHPSNEKFKVVKIKYFGRNLYTQNDQKTSPIPRTFWYTTIPIPERDFQNSKYIYVARIKKSDIYDLEEDSFNFKKKFSTINSMLEFLSKEYLGVKYKVGSYYLVAIFKDISPVARLTNKEII